MKTISEKTLNEYMSEEILPTVNSDISVSQIEADISEKTKQVIAELENKPALSSTSEMIRQMAGMGQPNTTYQTIVVDNRRNSNITTWVGNSPQAKIEKSKQYFSKYKSYTLIFSDKIAIKFRERNFYTDNTDLQRLIEQHPIFGEEIWADAFPTWFVNKLKADDRLVSRERPDNYDE